MKAFVCDDDRKFLDIIEKMLMESGRVEEVTAFQKTEEMIEELKKEEKPEIIFQDIDFEGEAAGLSCAARIREIAPDVQIIYITGYVDRFVQDVFLHEANLCGFLKKPVEMAKLTAFLEKAEERIKGKLNETLILKLKGKMEPVKISEILYLESEGHKVYLHTAERSHILYEKLDVIREQLPEELFLHCHKSFLVNMEHIIRIEPQKVLMKNQQEIRISRGKYPEAKAKYFTYLRGNL